MIPFTQYMRPHGRREEVAVNRPEEIERLAKELQVKGCKFEIEELMTGEISMTVEDKHVEEFGPVSMQVCQNGPKVPEAVDALIRSAHKRINSGTYPPEGGDDGDDVSAEQTEH